MADSINVGYFRPVECHDAFQIPMTQLIFDLQVFPGDEPQGKQGEIVVNDFDKGLNINIGHDGFLRLMVTDFSQLGCHLLQVLSASFAICKALETDLIWWVW